jgi:DNA-directed RNA polymerase subunit E'/Rpb7
MIGLAVYLNGKRMTVAGADDLCVLNAIVNAVGELGTSTVRVGKRRSVDLHLSVGGLTRRAKGKQDEHLRWTKHRRLKIGDKISVQIVQTDKPDAYTEAHVAVKETPLQKRRRRQRLRLAMRRSAKTSRAVKS